MRFAVVSDIHGNLPALQAVLTDARARDVDGFWLLGDYIEDLPWPSEVVDAIRALENATIIAGNKEGYLVAMRREDQSAWVCDQFAPMYWNYRALTRENLDYLTTLPTEATFPLQNGERVHLEHASPFFFRKPKILAFHSSNYRERMLASPFAHDDYLEHATRSIHARPDAMAELASCANGVYAFGHNHLQWHMRHEGTLFVNPGSCGMPSDFNCEAPYTIVEQTADGWRVFEHRVPYDVAATLEALRASSLYEQAQVWSQMIMAGLKIGSDLLAPFFTHLDACMRRLGEPGYPVSNECWHLAANTFDLVDLS